MKALKKYSIIENHLNPDSLIHCKYVQELIRWYKRNGIKFSDLEELSRIYTSRIYEMYLKVSWDRLRDKDYFQYDDYNEYSRLKEKEIRESFVFEDKQNIDSFYNDFITERVTVDLSKEFLKASFTSSSVTESSESAYSNIEASSHTKENRVFAMLSTESKSLTASAYITRFALWKSSSQMPSARVFSR